MKRLFAIPGIAALLLSCFTATQALAEPGAGDSMRGEMLRELKLSPEQKDKLREFRSQRDDIKIIQAKVKLFALGTPKAAKAESLNESEIKSKSNELSSLISDLVSVRVNNMLTLRKTLNKDQFRKLREVISERKGQSFGHGGFKGRGSGLGKRGPGDGPQAGFRDRGGRGGPDRGRDSDDDILGGLGF